MPDRDVKTIRDLIYYQYAKVIVPGFVAELRRGLRCATRGGEEVLDPLLRNHVGNSRGQGGYITRPVLSRGRRIWACGRCNSAKSAKGLYQFFKDKYPAERKFYDLIPPLLEKKYLKTIINCHLCAGTLEKEDIDGDGELTVLDIDHIIA